MLYIYTDGSAKNNGSADAEGGFGVVIVLTEDEFTSPEDGVILDAHSEFYKGVTNNQMELKAIIWALEKYGKTQPSPIVFSDSAYSIGCLTDWGYKWKNAGWVKSDGKIPENLDLVKRYFDLRAQGYIINLQKVKGHSTNRFNNFADALATGQLKPEEIIGE